MANIKKDIKYLVKVYKEGLTEEEKERIDIESELYYQIGEEPTKEQIKLFIQELKKEGLKIKELDYPVRHIKILN